MREERRQLKKQWKGADGKRREGISVLQAEVKSTTLHYKARLKRAVLSWSLLAGKWPTQEAVWQLVC